MAGIRARLDGIPLAIELAAARQGRAAPATDLLAAAAALRERVHAPIAPADHARLMAALRADLGAAFDATWAAGRGASWERLVESTFSML